MPFLFLGLESTDYSTIKISAIFGFDALKNTNEIEKRLQSPSSTALAAVTAGAVTAGGVAANLDTLSKPTKRKPGSQKPKR
jgi:hypothetical protein